MTRGAHPRVTALAGGVGAARFLRGLVQVVPPEALTVIVNTGDDRDFFGLRVCPDLDIVTYTLAGHVRRDTGWGLEADTFRALDGLRRFRSDVWFALGDADLATHIHRTEQLARGASLSAVTAEIAAAFGVRVSLLPMTDAPAPTFVVRHDGSRTDFETYLVRDGAPDDVASVDLSAAARAAPAPGVLDALASADVLLVCPSNPIVSIGTIRAVDGVEATLRARRDAVAISPIIGGRPVKGPADRLMRAMGHEVSALGVAEAYRPIARALVIDTQDAELAPSIAERGFDVAVTDTLMHDVAIAERMGELALSLAKRAGGPSAPRDVRASRERPR
jgi:LPPG:FO 2-phospho-L-lactate transferase